VQLPSGQSPAPVIETIDAAGAEIQSLEIGQEGDRRNVEVTLAMRPDGAAHNLVTKVADVEGVLEVRWAD
jgi:hypothetical protein